MVIWEELLESLDYDPETGIFRWKIRKSGVTMGSVAGSTDTYGYIQIKINSKLYLAHRLAWFYVTGKWPEKEIDHRNTIRHDNKFHNLREATHLQNKYNSGKYKTNTSGFVGVTWYRRYSKWVAQISVNCKRINLGYFDDKIEAAKAYNDAALKYHKKFAKLNIIERSSNG